jgi:hypothetical protein
MIKSKLVRRFLLSAGIIIAIAFSIGTYLFFMPHRNVQKEEAFAILTAKELTDAYSKDSREADDLYLSQDGNSKVLVVTGTIAKISTNLDGEPVVLIMDAGDKVGVQATFLKEDGGAISGLKPGDQIAVKGAIAAGNSYDADLDLYEHAILTQAALVNNKK